MKIQGSRKNAFYILIAFIIIISVVLLIVLNSLYAKKYSAEPIKMKNLGKSTQTIDISSLSKKIEQQDVPVYFVHPRLHISNVEKMIDKMGLSLKREDIVKDSYVQWSDGENSFTYDSIQDTVSFQLTRRISLERGVGAFKDIFEKYLGINHEYVLIKERKSKDGGVTYYASRTLDGIPVQFGANYEYSEILKFNKEGVLESGQLLLAEFEKYDLYVPTITGDELKAYINAKDYPKEQYIDSSMLVETLNLNYLDDSWGDIEDTLDECKAQGFEYIFLYKNSNQGYLLPVIKISSNCNVSSKGSVYTVPATFYVNGVDPNYVTL